MWPYKCSNIGKTPIFRDSIYEVKMAILKSSDPLVETGGAPLASQGVHGTLVDCASRRRLMIALDSS